MSEPGGPVAPAAPTGRRRRRTRWASPTTSPGTDRSRSLAEAAAARGVEPHQVVKTMVVRVSEGEHLFVLVPGDREIAWPKLRALLGVNRLSMPPAEEAREVTGYVRGTITPLGSLTALPVIADASMTGPSPSVAVPTAWR